jgi:nitroimidazol reductase NimA-like FMN-containing flavoprotein (pyridoxamine 5'-phosphate oxidase superfamily)
MTEPKERCVDVLATDECVELLSAHHFGRVAVDGQGGPAIFPINYVWESGQIAIRTGRGSKLTEAAQSTIAFEIDDAEEASRSGWSVLVVGTAYEVTDSIDEMSEELRRLPVDSWVPGDKTAVVRIEPRAITGRAVRPDAWMNGR